MKKKLGLALGSGGACGLSHIGFLRAIEEQGITPDYISGTSMGSIIGAMYSCGVSLDDLEERVTRLKLFHLVDFEPLFLVQGGIVRGKKVESILREFLGNKLIEELNIPFATLAVNLKDGKPKIFRNGDIVNAIRASSAIPGVFLPIKIDDEYYIDGGILERVPCDLVRSMGADVVIGLDVIGEFASSDMPRGLIEVMQRAYMIVDDAYVKLKYNNNADIFIKMHQDDINPLKVKNLDRSIAYGYDAAIAHMDEILRLIY